MSKYISKEIVKFYPIMDSDLISCLTLSSKKDIQRVKRRKPYKVTFYGSLHERITREWAKQTIAAGLDFLDNELFGPFFIEIKKYYPRNIERVVQVNGLIDNYNKEYSTCNIIEYLN